MNENVNYAESCVKRKKDAELKRKKILLVLAYVIVPVILVILCFAFPKVLGWAILIVLSLSPFILAKIVIPITWCYTEIEYESIFSGGDLTVSYVYNRFRRKEMVKVDIRKAELIAPYTDEYKKKIEGMGSFDKNNTYNALSSPEAEGVYSIVFADDAGNKKLLLFEPSDKMIGLFTHFNRGTVVVKVNK